MTLAGYLRDEQGASCLSGWVFGAWKKRSVSTMVNME